MFICSCRRCDASNTMLRAYINPLSDPIVVLSLSHKLVVQISFIYAILLFIFHHGTSEKVEVVMCSRMVRDGKNDGKGVREIHFFFLFQNLIFGVECGGINCGMRFV